MNAILIARDKEWLKALVATLEINEIMKVLIYFNQHREDNENDEELDGTIE